MTSRLPEETNMTTALTTPVEIDTAIAEAHKEYSTAVQYFRASVDAAHYQAGDRRDPLTHVWGMDWSDVVDKLVGHEVLSDVARAIVARDVAAREWRLLEDRYTGWSRFYLVTNTNGHIHSSTDCSTCFPSTNFAWLTELSGTSEADAVEAHGEILCSVCFPSAPVEWTNGESKATKQAREEREAKKAERQAKKVAKALVPSDPEGGLVIRTGTWTERLKTIASAKTWLTDASVWAQIYAEQGKGGSHPSYPADAVQTVAQVLAERTETTVEDVLSAAQKRAAKHLR